MIIYSCDRCHLRGVPTLMGGFKRCHIVRRDMNALKGLDGKEMDLCQGCQKQLDDFWTPQPSLAEVAE